MKSISTRLSLLPIVALLGAIGACTTSDASDSSDTATAAVWDDERSYLGQDSAWYASADAVKIADDLLWYQQASGGWPTLSSRIRTLADDSAALPAQKDRNDAWIIATARKLQFLTRVHRETGLERLEAPIARGIEYLISTQYANGGLPKIFPDTAYRDARDSSHNPRGRVPLISLNDGAMPMAMVQLLAASRGAPGYEFLDPELRARAARSVEAGTQALVKLQIESNGRPSGWAQQFDEVTMEPRWGRKFEPKAIASRETIDVLRFLVQLDDPRPEVVQAIQTAVAWLDQVKLLGIREEIATEPTEVYNWDGTVLFTDRYDHWIVEDSTAPPLWAHFYEIDTERPVFAHDDDTTRYALADITMERRSGYDWYGYWPADFFANEYAAWLERTGQPTALTPETAAAAARAREAGR